MEWEFEQFYLVTKCIIFQIWSVRKGETEHAEKRVHKRRDRTGSS